MQDMEQQSLSDAILLGLGQMDIAVSTCSLSPTDADLVKVSVEDSTSSNDASYMDSRSALYHQS
jgi:hypothetical protein